MGRQLLIIPEDLSSPVFIFVLGSVAQSVVLCVAFCRLLFFHFVPFLCYTTYVRHTWLTYWSWIVNVNQACVIWHWPSSWSLHGQLTSLYLRKVFVTMSVSSLPYSLCSPYFVHKSIMVDAWQSGMHPLSFTSYPLSDDVNFSWLCQFLPCHTTYDIYIWSTYWSLKLVMHIWSELDLIFMVYWLCQIYVVRE